jgi:two-component system, OmpR family, sensor kinase
LNLRSRLFGTYALVIVVCLAIVAVAITAVFQGYRDRLAMDRLDNMARPISVQIRSIVSTATTIDRLWTNLEEQAQRNNVYIIVGRRDGTVVRQITPSLDAEPIEVAPRFMPHPVLKSVLGRFTARDGKVFVYAAYPLARLQTALPLQADDVVLATPRTGSLAILAGLMLPLVAGGIVALLVSLLVAMILARSFSKPLNDMGAAARRIAAGDYDHTVPIEGPEEIRELAKDFNQMTSEVKRSQQQLRHFVADVSHELKSPLTSIQGFSQALVDGTAADETTRSKAAGIINSESKRMRRQVDELLELSRMQSGQFRISKEPTDVSAVVSRCAEIFELQAQERGLTL